MKNILTVSLIVGFFSATAFAELSKYSGKYTATISEETLQVEISKDGKVTLNSNGLSYLNEYKGKASGVYGVAEGEEPGIYGLADAFGLIVLITDEYKNFGTDPKDKDCKSGVIYKDVLQKDGIHSVIVESCLVKW